MLYDTQAAGVTPGRSHLRFEECFGLERMTHLAGAQYHDVEIRDEHGAILFEQDHVSAPNQWSKRAVQVAASKYFFGPPNFGRDPRRGGRESSIYALISRVCAFIARKGAEQGHIHPSDRDIFFGELVGLTLGQYAAFNSPVWFNVGVGDYGVKGGGTAYAWDKHEYDHEGSWATASEIHGKVVKVEDTYARPQGSACFIQSVKDDIDSIMDLACKEARLFKYGSGSGTDLSPIRSRKERLSGGGIPSGPMSFARVYDTVASVIKSGGKTRRAAKMQTMHISHPDILEFIEAKGKEEQKAQALIAAGYDANFNGEAYSSVAFQNANFSVRITDEFMRSLERCRTTPWGLVSRTTGRTLEYVQVGDIWDAIAIETWRCGDPGLQFTDTINEWHTTPHGMDGTPTPINSSNPCSEYLSIDDSACNLASLNLRKFVDGDGRIDIPKLKAAVRVMVVAMDVLVDACSYPTQEIAANAHAYRQLGLGFANLGGLLMAAGIPYDSPSGRSVAASLAALIGGEAYRVSARMAEEMGPFDAFEVNREPMLRVIGRHRQAAETLGDLIRAFPPRGPALVQQLPELIRTAEMAWALAEAAGAEAGYRNAQATVIAPTGTIAFMMDCDTTGIEPNLALVAKKTLAGGGTMLVVNGLVAEALDALGFNPVTCENSLAEIKRYIVDHGTAEGCPYLEPSEVAVFDSSFAPPGFSRVLDWRAHLKMMAAVQPFISGAISKTVNTPNSFGPDEVADVYAEAWHLGLKCVAIYRDGSKGSQPLEAVGKKSEVPAAGCLQCGHAILQRTGTCTICPECGTPQGGCS